ncbi:MAG: hypothetical protein V4662_17655 [Verrucomicrobiota bacterium]
MSVKIRIMGRLPAWLGSILDDNQRYWIAGEPGVEQAKHSGIANEQRGITRKNSEAPGNDFPFVKLKDTKNEGLTFSFSTSRLFDTPAAAWRWCNDFSSLSVETWPHPIEGDCVMRFENADSTWEEARLYDVLMSKPTMERTGQTVRLNYTLRGGRIESTGTGVDAIPVADHAAPGYVHLKLYGETTDGTDITDFKTGQNFSGLAPSTTLTTGSTLTVHGIDNGNATVTEKTFEVIDPAGSVTTPGNIPILTPLHEHLEDIAAAFNADPYMTAIYQDDGARPYALLAWAVAPFAVIGDITLTVSAGTPGGADITEENTGGDDNSVPLSPAYPVDDAGTIPVADFLT